MAKPFGPHRRLQVESLEDRSLPATGVIASLSAGVLTVKGTELADSITVRQSGASTVTLVANGASRVYLNVSRVDIDGRGGDDSIYIDTRAVEGTRFAPIPAKVQGGLGNDLIVGGAGNDSLYGGEGEDKIYGGAGNDWIEGQNGSDKLYGNAGDDKIFGGAGDDLIVGGLGNDFVDAGIGNDDLYGNEGNDSLLGGVGDDYIDGGVGNDSLYGGDGKDWLFGAGGDDNLDGGAGDDYLSAGTGNDTFVGGTGFNVYRNEFGNFLTKSSITDESDINQGRSGTCVFLASLAAVTKSGTNLSSRIKQTGTNQYAVTLYRPGTGWVQQTVYFDGSWSDNDPMVADPSEAWVLIYFRAFLQEMGVKWTDPNSDRWADKYGAKFQRADAALISLTGSATWHDGVNGLDSADQRELVAAMKSDSPTIALTKTYGVSSYGLIQGHAYTVIGVTQTSSGTKVTLRNPWGVDGPVVQGANDGVITISWDVFSRVTQGFCVA